MRIKWPLPLHRVVSSKGWLWKTPCRLRVSWTSPAWCSTCPHRRPSSGDTGDTSSHTGPCWGTVQSQYTLSRWIINKARKSYSCERMVIQHSGFRCLFRENIVFKTGWYDDMKSLTYRLTYRASDWPYPSSSRVAFATKKNVLFLNISISYQKILTISDISTVFCFINDMRGAIIYYNSHYHIS